jgi:hypothetical protein
MAHPASSARGTAPRLLAEDARSRTTKPAPSPRFSPFLLASKGRHRSGSVADSALKPLSVRRQMASVPPATTASTSPDKSHRAPMARALAPLEHALQTERLLTNGPRASERRSPVDVRGCITISTSDPAVFMSTCSRASDGSVSYIPPTVPPTTRPRRSPRSRPACVIASRAALHASRVVRDQRSG